MSWIREGSFSVETPIAGIVAADGTEQELTMVQRWPVRRPIPEAMFASGWWSACSHRSL